MTTPLSWDELDREFAPTSAASWDDLDAEFTAAPPAPPRRGVVRDVLSGVGRGLARSGYRTAIGLADLVGANDTADGLRASRDAADAFYGESETTAGKVASGVAGFAGDAAQFALPGGLVNRIAKLPAFAKSLPGLAKVVAPATAKGRVARDLVLNAPVNLAAGIQREESAAATFGELLDSDRLRAVADNTGGRLTFELGLDAATGGLLESAAGVLARRGARKVGRARVEEMRQQTPSIRGGMDQLSKAEAAAKAGAADLTHDGKVGEHDACCIDATGAGRYRVIRWTARRGRSRPNRCRIGHPGSRPIYLTRNSRDPRQTHSRIGDGSRRGRPQ